MAKRANKQKSGRDMARKDFISDESGAVTLDWLVLSVAIIGLAIVVLSSVSSSIFGPEFAKPVPHSTTTE